MKVVYVVVHENHWMIYHNILNKPCFSSLQLFSICDAVNDTINQKSHIPKFGQLSHQITCNYDAKIN